MRIILIGILVLLALWVIISGLLSKKRTSRGRISWLLVFVVLIPAGALTYFEWKWQTDIDTMSENIVQNISGVPGSKLECQRMSAAYVDVWASEKTIEEEDNTIAGLKYNYCAELFGYLRAESPKPVPTIEQVTAFHLLSKEATRIAGKAKSEKDLVCLGAINIPIVVQGLGGTENDGIYAYRLFKQEVLDKDPDYSIYDC